MTGGTLFVLIASILELTDLFWRGINVVKPPEMWLINQSPPQLEIG
jgi:hypothetical protein